MNLLSLRWGSIKFIYIFFSMFLILYRWSMNRSFFQWIDISFNWFIYFINKYLICMDIRKGMFFMTAGNIRWVLWNFMFWNIQIISIICLFVSLIFLFLLFSISGTFSLIQLERYKEGFVFKNKIADIIESTIMGWLHCRRDDLECRLYYVTRRQRCIQSTEISWILSPLTFIFFKSLTQCLPMDNANLACGLTYLRSD